MCLFSIIDLIKLVRGRMNQCHRIHRHFNVHNVCKPETNDPFSLHEMKAIMSLLLQIDRGLSVETLVLSLHVGETCEVIGVDEGQIDLKKNRKFNNIRKYL